MEIQYYNRAYKAPQLESVRAVIHPNATDRLYEVPGAIHVESIKPWIMIHQMAMGSPSTTIRLNVPKLWHGINNINQSKFMDILRRVRYPIPGIKLTGPNSYDLFILDRGMWDLRASFATVLTVYCPKEALDATRK